MKAIAIIAAALGLAACTPHQVEVFKTLDPASQRAVLDELAARDRPSDCYAAIDRHWPGDKAWARSIVWRESRNTPAARNPSGASGCWQLMLPLHAHRFLAVGCPTWAWADPVCNTRAAAHLYAAAGMTPWGLS